MYTLTISFYFQSSFSEVAKLFTEFFRDLDVVPTDVIAGLVLLRRHQKVRRKFIVEQVCSHPRLPALGSKARANMDYCLEL